MIFKQTDLKKLYPYSINATLSNINIFHCMFLNLTNINLIQLYNQISNAVAMSLNTYFIPNLPRKMNL